MKLQSILTLAALALCSMARAACGDVTSIPEGIAFDASGNLWQTDYVNFEGTSYVWDMGVPPTQWPSDGCYTVWLPTSVTVPPSPTRLAFQGNELAVASSAANQVTVFTNLSTATSWSITGLQRPLGVALDPSGNVFVAENASSDIAVYSAAGTRLGAKTQDASGHAFTAPGALAINRQTLYVGTNEGSVHAYSVQNFLASLGSNCIHLNGRTLCDYFNPTEAGTFADGVSSGPTGIAFDAQGSVYVCYYYSGDVVKYSSTGTKLMTLTNAISQPEGIAVSPTNGWIYVANTGSQQITVYTAAGVYLGVFGMLGLQ